MSAPTVFPILFLEIDGLLAATAKKHDPFLATRNPKDIAWTGVGYVNPFDARSR